MYHIVNDRLCSVNLVDSYYAADASKFVSVLLMSLSSMLQTELPHVNILSKMDLIHQYGPLAFNLDFYTDVLDLSHLIETIGDDKRMRKYKRLNAKICDVVQDFSLVAFTTLNIQKKSSVIKCIQHVDKANGYLFSCLDDQQMMSAAQSEISDRIDEEDDDDENDFLAPAPPPPPSSHAQAASLLKNLVMANVHEEDDEDI